VVDLGDELLLEALRGVQAFVTLANQHLQVVVRLLNFADVDFLKLYNERVRVFKLMRDTYRCHLVEPVEDDFLLVVIEASELVEEVLLPENLGVCEHLVSQLDAGEWPSRLSLQ